MSDDFATYRAQLEALVNLVDDLLDRGICSASSSGISQLSSSSNTMTSSTSSSENVPGRGGSPRKQISTYPLQREERR